MKDYRQIKNLFIIFLFFGLLIVSFYLFNDKNNGRLVVSFLDIGQGDSIYIQAPNGNQILIDGGPDSRVLRELRSVLGIFDKHINIILVTNPDKDHIGGFIDVLKNYKVDYVIEPGTLSGTQTYKTLGDSILNEEGIEKIIARRGMKVILDKENNVYIEILYPDREVKNLSTNDGSIVTRLVYGKTSIMLQGDAPASVEKHILSIDKENIKSDILKIGHHGSFTSTDYDYVKNINPEYAVISLGKNNRYGHPHKETLDTLNKLNIKILRTDEVGRITFYSNGENFFLK